MLRIRSRCSQVSAYADTRLTRLKRRGRLDLTEPSQLAPYDINDYDPLGMYGADNDAHHRYSLRGWMAINQPHGIALPSAAVGAVDRCCLSTNCRSVNFAPELKRVRRSLHRAPYTNQREQHPLTRERTRAKIPQQSTCTHKDASTHRHVHVRKAETRTCTRMRTHALTTHAHRMRTHTCTCKHGRTDGLAHLRPDPYVRRPPRAPLLGIF
jgi:hypothetical protein